MEEGNSILVGAPYLLWRDTIRHFMVKGCNFVVFGWRNDAENWKKEGVIFYDIESMWKLGFPPEDNGSSFLQWRLDNSDKFLELIAMMDRLESNMYQFPHQLKENIIYNCLTFFDSILVKYKISSVIMTNIPHRVWDNCIYHVAHARDVKTTLFALTQFGSNVMVYSKVDGMPLRHDGRFCTNVTVVERAVRKWKEVSDEFMPRDMVIQKTENRSFLLYVVRKYFGKVGRFNTSRLKELCSPNTYRNFEARSLIPSRPKWHSFILDSVKKYYKIEKLRRSYKFLSKKKLPDKYVYYPLHYQPEETTLPSGLGYYNQTELIRYLTNSFPDDLWLVVKEHPSQFYHSNEGDRGRYLGIYQDILSVGGRVVLASMELNSIEVLKNSVGVITVNGTVGVEALHAGKSVLTFGRVWYSGLRGVCHISSTTPSDFVGGLKSSQEDINTDNIDWMKFLLSVKVYKEHTDLDDITLKESTLNLISYLENVVFT